MIKLYKGTFGRLEVKNIFDVEHMLNEAQKRCSERVLLPNEVVAEVIKLDGYLHKERGIPRNALEGTTAQINLYSQSFPRSYKGVAKSTFIYVTYGKSGYPQIAGCSRCPASKKYIKITLSEAGKAKALEAISQGK